MLQNKNADGAVDDIIQKVDMLRFSKVELLKTQQKDSGFIEEDADEIKIIDDAEDFLQNDDDDTKVVGVQQQDSSLGNGLKRRMQIVTSPATQRRCAIADYYFLDYYFDLLTYLNHRKQRLQAFNEKAEHLQAKKTKEFKSFAAQETAFLRMRRTRTSMGQFSVLAQIGQGGYGQVFLAKKKDSGEICALKKMNKKVLQKMNEVDHILTERDVLVQTRTPWLVSLLYAFQDFDHVYLAMEYVPGGDMRTLLNNSGVLNERDARFYAAEMFMAVGELHRLGYIHRDLKPENFLIDQTGHVKLTDFGLSKGNISVERVESLRKKLIAVRETQTSKYSSFEKRQFHQDAFSNSTRAFSLVGSPDYMAPEVLVNSNHAGRSGVYAPGYDYLVDYWSLGCMLFEFLAGYPPFAGPSNEDVWVNVYHWQEVLERPQFSSSEQHYNMSDIAWHLITSLITHRHLRVKTLAQLQNHTWFRPFNDEIERALLKMRPRPEQRPILWSYLRDVPHGMISPPFVPNLNNELDTKHFDDFSSPDALNMYKEVYEKQRRIDEECEELGVDSQKTRNAFTGFTFRHKKAVDFQRVPPVPPPKRFFQ